MKRFGLVLAVSVMGILAGCGGESPPAPGEGEASPGDGQAEAPAEQANEYTIAVIPKGLGHQFWNTVRAGAEAAGDEFGAKILWNGPAKETEIAKQMNIITDMVNRKVDAVVMAACDENALVDTVHMAIDREIPVVTIDSGVKTDRTVSFVATDNKAGARAAADILAELIGGSGEVGLIPFVPGAATSEMREQGFKEGIEAIEGVELVSTIHCNSDVAKAMAAMQDMMTAHPEIKGVFAANEPACLGARSALEAAGRAGEIKLVAFDASEDQITALQEGSVQALIVQNPFKMGYDGVKAAIDALEGREVEKRIDTGVTTVTMENFNEPDVQKLLYPLD